MNAEQWSSIIRTILALALGPTSYLVARGFLTAEQANQLIPVLVPLVLAGGGALLAKWGAASHSAQAVVAAVNSDSVPGVKVVRASSPALQVTVTDKGEVKTDPAVLAAAETAFAAPPAKV